MEGVEQRTDLWDEARRGKFTASKMSKLMTDPRNKSDQFSDAAWTYILERVSEILVGPKVQYTDEAMVWGIEQEAVAKRWYTRVTGLTVQECGFIEYDEHSGGSPDGKTTKGIIEVKCPFNTTHHIRHILESDDFRTNFKEHYWQMQMNMLVTETKECDFISFDPRVDSDAGLFIKTIERDDTDIAEMINRIKVATEAKLMILNKLK